MAEEIEEFDQKRADRIIWKYLGRLPVTEIAKKTGMRPEDVLRRKNELFTEIDVLTIQQKRQKAILELDEMAADARRRYSRVTDEFAAGLLNSSVAAMKTVLAELNRLENKDSGEVDKLNALRVRELLRLMDLVVNTSVREIAATHGLDEKELREVFKGNLNSAARELDEGEAE